MLNYLSNAPLAVVVAGLLFAVTLLGAHTYSAHADVEPVVPTFHVNTNFSDAPDASPGNGKCETANGNNLCTIRAAIQESNANPGAEIIMIPVLNPILLLRPGADNTALNGDLDITGPLTINGSSTIIEGGGAALGERVLHIRPGANVTINQLSVRHGMAPLGEGGGVILNEGTLTLNGSYVSTGNALYGGGISNSGVLNMNGGGIRASSARYGGGIDNSGSASLRNVYITVNEAESGGGVTSWSGTLSITNSTISSNKASRDGGGINVQPPGAVNLFNVTIANNDANSDLNSSGFGGGINAESGGISLRNTLVANNHRLSINGSALNDCSGTLHSANYNLIRVTVGCTIGGTLTNNIIGTDPKLDTLKPNPMTFTHALLINSPAIDTANPAGCADPQGEVLTRDQLGFIRPVDGNGNSTKTCDIGAYEYLSPGEPTATPTKTATVPPTNTLPPGTATPTATPLPNSCIGKPAAPSPLAPTDNALLAKKKVKLDWSDADCADKYKVLVKKDSQGGPRADRKTTTTSEYKTKELAKGHTYHWRVKACNTKGCTKSPWSTYTIQP